MKEQSSSLPFDQLDDGTKDKTLKNSKSLFIDPIHSYEFRDEREVWSSFQEGHEGAFTFIYDTYFEILYNHGCQFTRDTGLVEDLLQDFFVGLRRDRKKSRNVSFIKAYLLKSFRRKVLRHLKKKKIVFFSDRIIEGDFQIFFHHDMQFMKTQFRQEQQIYIERMLNELTPREREAVYYFYFENLDYKSISQVMRLSSPKSARNLIYKALSSLKKNKHLFPKWLQYCMLLC